MPIEFRDFTGGERQGSGNFDELMRAVQSHIKKELDDGRITEQNYASTYLGAMQYAIQASLQFTLQAQINNQQELLLQEQVNNTALQNQLIQAQIDEIKERTLGAAYNRTDIMPEQKGQITAQTTLLGSQNATEGARLTLTTNQAAQVLAQEGLTGKQEALVDEQIKTENANTTNATAGQAFAQLQKTQSEKAILDQKLVTETAQTKGDPYKSGTADEVAGLIGMQMKLQLNQGDAFLRDAEQKAAKLYSDTFSIMFSTNPDSGTAASDPTAWNLGWKESHEVMWKLMQGVGITTDPTYP